MPDPRVITFEKDIEEEIRSKAASLTDIASASGFVASKPEAVKKPSAFLLPSLILLFILIGMGVGFYYLTQRRGTAAPIREASTQTNIQVAPKTAQNQKATTTSEAASSSERQVPIMAKTLSKVDREDTATKRLTKTPLSELLPKTSPFIETNITKVETASQSYILSFTGYSDVFKKINDHESDLAEDLIFLYSVNATATETSTSTTTKIFRDVRINAIDTRELSYDNNQKVYYAIIKPSTLLISPNKKTIEELSSAILK